MSGWTAMLASSTLLPWWAVVPVAALAMVFIAAHLLVIHSASMPTSRRRIRTVNGFLMLFVTALLASAMGIISPDQARAFVLTWILVVALLVIVLVVALMDIAYSMRLHRSERQGLRTELTEQVLEAVRRRGAAGGNGASTGVGAEPAARAGGDDKP